MWNAGLDEAQAEIKIARRNINNLRYANDTTLMAESEEELEESLDESERGEWKSWLKAQHSENYINCVHVGWIKKDLKEGDRCWRYIKKRDLFYNDHR